MQLAITAIHWLYVNVTGNLVASLITTLGMLLLHKRQRRHQDAQIAWLRHIAHKLEEDA